MVFMQPEIERLLRENVAVAGTVRVRLGQTVHGVAQNADAVTLALRDEGGHVSTISARYVIACDGSTSTTRQSLGIEFDDLGFDQPWLVVDVVANERGLAKLPKTSVQYCEPQRPTTFVIGTGAHRRWEIMLSEDEDPRQMEKPDSVWRLLSRWITPDDARLWRSASYRFHALVARQWQSGRIFLAGDAAHQQPPFLGQGLCQGVRDVANLSWKLERVLSGQSQPAIMQSYAIERSTHVRKLTGIIKSIGSLIAERDPTLAAERDIRLIAEAGGAVRSMPRQDLMPGLENGLLSTHVEGGVGTLFPQPWVNLNGQRCRLDDVCKHGFLVVLAASFSPVSDDFYDVCRSLDAQIVRITTHPSAVDGESMKFGEIEGVVETWFSQHGCTAAIVRPDRYVFAVASDRHQLMQQLHELDEALK